MLIVWIADFRGWHGLTRNRGTSDVVKLVYKITQIFYFRGVENFFLTDILTGFKTENHPHEKVDNLFSRPARRQLNLRNSFRLWFYFWDPAKNHLSKKVGNLSHRPVSGQLSIRNSFRLLLYFCKSMFEIVSSISHLKSRNLRDISFFLKKDRIFCIFKSNFLNLCNTLILYGIITIVWTISVRGMPSFQSILIFLKVAYTNATQRKIQSEAPKRSPRGAICVSKKNCPNFSIILNFTINSQEYR